MYVSNTFLLINQTQCNVIYSIDAQTCKEYNTSRKSNSIAKHPKTIPVLWSHLLEAGEATGDIIGVLKRISVQMEQSISLVKKIVTAMAYPAVLVMMMIAAISVFLLFVIPTFEKTFKTLNAKLPPITIAVIKLSEFARDYFLVIVACAVGLIYLFRKYVETSQGRRAVDLWLIRLPVFGSMVRDIILARIAIYLTAVLSSGVGMIYGLEIVSRACGNAIYREALENVMEEVRDGASLSNALGKFAVFPPMMIQMVIVGEESGKLPAMIEKVAGYYDARISTVVARFSAFIEPAILILLGAIVGVVVIALLLPIVTAVSRIH